MKKNVLIAPLNWGLGHAARCVPIIKEVLRNGHHVVLASDGGAKRFLEIEFPDLEVEELPGYAITYPRRGSFLVHIAKKLPQIVNAIYNEHNAIKPLVKKHQIDVIISDNRYGLYAKNVKSIILTHQTNVALALGEKLVNIQIHRYLKKFDEVWVPDVKENVNVSGKLSHKILKGVAPKYLGALSRMNTDLKAVQPSGFPFKADFVLGIVSGPEPQRSVFEKKLVLQGTKLGQTMVIVGGDFQHENAITTGNLHCIPFVNSTELNWLIQNSNAIISRSGYSTIMDLIALKKTAILIPTPGQTEQEYLADHLKDWGIFEMYSQKEFQLKDALKSISSKTWDTQYEAFLTPETFTEIIHGI